MGDRTFCTLEIWGIASRDAVDEIYSLIESELCPLDSNLEEEFESEDGSGRISIDEVNYGELEPSIHSALTKAGLSYDWTWGEGDDYNAGFILYDATTKKEYTNHLINGEIALTLSQLEEPQALTEAREALEILKRPRGKICIHIANSSHDEIQIISKYPEMAAHSKSIAV